MSKALIWEIVFLCVVIYCLFIVAFIEHKNGRIEMCNELGNKYLTNDTCITGLEYQSKNNNGDWIAYYNLSKKLDEDLGLI